MNEITIEFLEEEDQSTQLAELVETIKLATAANARAIDFLIDVVDFLMEETEEEDEYEADSFGDE